MHQLGNGISGASQAGCIAPVNGGGISSIPRTTPKGKNYRNEFCSVLL